MKNENSKKLVFIYNADSGLRNMILDGAHKIFSPATYPCSLCDITYGSFSENQVWKKFRKGSDIQMVFLHKDEFAAGYASKFGHKFTFPIVLSETNHGLEVCVKTEELNAMEKTQDLINLLKERQDISKNFQ